jgi:hypothetical protein
VPTGSPHTAPRASPCDRRLAQYAFSIFGFIRRRPPPPEPPPPLHGRVLGQHSSPTGRDSSGFSCREIFPAPPDIDARAPTARHHRPPPLGARDTHEWTLRVDGEIFFLRSMTRAERSRDLNGWGAACATA